MIPMHAGSTIAFPKKGTNSYRKINAETPDANDETAEAIIKDLKKWRKRKADDMNIPPYAIFGDKTLLDMAAKKAKNKGRTS